VTFELSEEQRAIEKASREFAEGEFLPEVALEHDLAQRFPREIWQKACRLGFIGIHFPETFGGQGYGLLENILVTEQFCRKDSGLGIALSFSDYASEIVLRFGDEAQKGRFLTPITKGIALSAGALTEAGNGCDFREVSMKARRDGDSYVLNGKKNFVINGLEADWFIVLCQTDGGPSLFLVEKGTEGMEIHSSGERMGIHMTSMGEVAFNRVRVPVENLIGTEGGGSYQTIRFFREVRFEVGAQAVGIGQGALEQAVIYAKRRVQFGRPIIENEGLQWMLVEMATQVEAARAFLYRVAYQFERGDDRGKAQSAMVKLFASDVAMRVCTDAVQVLGGYGYMEDYPLERMMRDVKATQIFPETNQIQKIVVADHLKHMS
jgi:acyl-CoA dehydrogenase